MQRRANNDTKKELESKRKKFKIKDEVDVIPSDLEFTSEYLSYLNAIQLIFSSALLKVRNFSFFTNFIIKFGDAFTMKFEDDRLKTDTIPQNSTFSYFIGRDITQYKGNPIHNDHRILFRQSIPLNVFQKCFQDISLVIHNGEAIQMLSIINSALSEYQNLNFRQALIQAWFVIEYYINKKWVDYLYSKQIKINENKNRIDSKRRDFLTGRYMTSSIISNILELNDLIDHDIIEKINIVRGKRNFAVHNTDLIEKLTDIMKTKPGKKKDKRVSEDDCWNAFLVIVDFFKSEYNLELRLGRSFSYSPIFSRG